MVTLDFGLRNVQRFYGVLSAIMEYGQDDVKEILGALTMFLALICTCLLAPFVVLSRCESGLILHKRPLR